MIDLITSIETDFVTEKYLSEIRLKWRGYQANSKWIESKIFKKLMFKLSCKYNKFHAHEIYFCFFNKSHLGYSREFRILSDLRTIWWDKFEEGMYYIDSVHANHYALFKQINEVLNDSTNLG